MKAIIYAGISLFSAASIYGVVDYYNTNKKGTLDKMYKAEEPVVTSKTEIVSTITLPVVPKIESKTVDTNVTTVKTSSKKVIKKTKKYVREIKFSDFSRGKIMPQEKE